MKPAQDIYGHFLNPGDAIVLATMTNKRASVFKGRFNGLSPTGGFRVTKITIRRYKTLAGSDAEITWSEYFDHPANPNRAEYVTVPYGSNSDVYRNQVKEYNEAVAKFQKLFEEKTEHVEVNVTLKTNQVVKV